LRFDQAFSASSFAWWRNSRNTASSDMHVVRPEETTTPGLQEVSKADLHNPLLRPCSVEHVLIIAKLQQLYNINEA
jgi:hypothetical protein